MSEGQNTSRFLSNPVTLANESIAYARNMGGVKFYLDVLDMFTNPMRKNELLIFLARPGHGKTTFWIALMNHISKHLPEHRMPLFVTRETIVEDIGISMMANLSDYTVSEFYREEVPDEEIVKAGMRLASLRFNVFGRKAANYGDQTAMQEELDLNAVYAEIMTQRSVGLDPAFIVFDYAQKFKPAGSRNYNSEQQDVATVFKQMETFCLTVGIPTVVLAQAGRQVDDRTPQVPKPADVQWSSTGEQVASRVFGMVRPAVIYDPSNPQYMTVDFYGKEYENSHELIILFKWKGRGELPTGVLPLRFNPADMSIGEMRSIDLNNVGYNPGEAIQAVEQMKMGIGL